MAPRDVLFRLLLGEVEACAGHSKHTNCNCQHTVRCVLRRMEMDGYTVLDSVGDAVLAPTPGSDDPQEQEG